MSVRRNANALSQLDTIFPIYASESLTFGLVPLCMAYVDRLDKFIRPSSPAPSVTRFTARRGHSAGGLVLRIHAFFKTRLVRKSSRRCQGGRLSNPHPNSRTGNTAHPCAP